jgi:CheY-like chemotaxis protein
MAVLCIDNEPKILDGMDALLGGWGCRVFTATDLKSAVAVLGEAKVSPHGLLVDYHLDQGNGIEAIVQLRWRFGPDLPAILITADRSPAVREEARARDIVVLNKPLKPAALRALLAQWRVHRVAAAE